MEESNCTVVQIVTNASYPCKFITHTIESKHKNKNKRRNIISGIANTIAKYFSPKKVPNFTRRSNMNKWIYNKYICVRCLLMCFELLLHNLIGTINVFCFT